MTPSRIATANFIARCLAPAEFDTDIEAYLPKTEAAWRRALTLANKELVSSALWPSLNCRGTASKLPAEISEYLRHLYLANRERNDALRQQLKEAIGFLNQAGLVPVILKGSTFLLDDTTADIGVRMMRDIDLLLSEEDSEKAFMTLRRVGYSPWDGGRRDYARHHHHAPLIHRDRHAAIEVHRRLASWNARGLLSTQEAWQNTQRLKTDSLEYAVLTPERQALHMLMHAEVMNHAYYDARINYRGLQDHALLRSKFDTQLDWSEVRRLLARHGAAHIFDAQVYKARRLMGLTPPVPIRTTWRTRRHYARCLIYIRLPAVGFVDRSIRMLRFFSAPFLRYRYPYPDTVIGRLRGRLSVIRYALKRLRAGKPLTKQ